jgi:hypothetical protein
MAPAVSGSALAGPKDETPPDGVYTCSWIADHRAAAKRAGVSCDPADFFSGQHVSAREPGSVTALSQGCTNVPVGGGRVGQGVFAWTTYQYSNKWGWYGRYSPAYYTYYLQKSGNVTYTWGQIFDTGSYILGAPSNIYRWGAQNHSSTPQSWYVCWND